jgi:hypothetical protein
MNVDLPSDLTPLLERWVGAGIISADQADRIRADVATMPSGGRPKGASLVAEAVGYLGGVIVLVGLGLVVGWFWNDLSTAARIGLAGGVAVAMLVAGAYVPGRLGPTGARLRAVLWAASSVALFSCLVVVGDDGLSWDEDRVLLLAAGGTAIVSAVLWRLHRRLPQHIVVLVSLTIAASAGTALVTEAYPWSGLAIWAVGTVWLGLSLADLLPRRAGTVLGAIGAVIGAVVVVGEGWGTALALVTVAALVLAAVALRDLALLGVGSVGTLIVLPIVVDRYFPGVLPAALSLVGVGLLLVVTAVFVSRRRRATPDAPAPGA